MGRLKRAGDAILSALRWVRRRTRDRLSPRGRVVFDWVVGSTLILLGLVTGPIPVIQGWMFGIPGLIILSRHSKWARRLLERFKKAGRSVRDRIDRER